MAGMRALPDFSVTPEKIEEAVRRIVEHAHPLQIIAFGSRARGDHREDSDLDLAVILDDDSDQSPHARVPYTLLSRIFMEVDMIVATKTKYDLHRPWRNSVYNHISKEGVLLYDRDYPERACPHALQVGLRGGVVATLSAT